MPCIYSTTWKICEDKASVSPQRFTLDRSVRSQSSRTGGIWQGNGFLHASLRSATSEMPGSCATLDMPWSQIMLQKLLPLRICRIGKSPVGFRKLHPLYDYPYGQERNMQAINLADAKAHLSELTTASKQASRSISRAAASRSRGSSPWRHNASLSMAPCSNR